MTGTEYIIGLTRRSDDEGESPFTKWLPFIDVATSVNRIDWGQIIGR
jgi:hypothetical protein